MIDLFGWISGALFLISYVPQLIRTYKLKSVDDISPWMLALLACAYILGVIYGVLINSAPLTYNYLLGFNLILLWGIMFYLYRDPRKDEVRNEVRKLLKDVRRKFK
jgi:MtN3 and saliva related transmembrane protein